MVHKYDTSMSVSMVHALSDRIFIFSCTSTIRPSSHLCRGFALNVGRMVIVFMPLPLKPVRTLLAMLLPTLIFLNTYAIVSTIFRPKTA